MSKVNLKKSKLDEATLSMLTKAGEKFDLSLVDLDRVIPKTEGGEYTADNVRVLTPQDHMKRHGNFREREASLEVLKSLIDAREQMRKQVNSANNRLLAMRRQTDILDPNTIAFLEEQKELTESKLGKMDRRIEKFLKTMDYPIIDVALGVMGVGPIIVAYLLTYVDIEKAKHASSLWSYVGLHRASYERYTKGESGGGNKNLRTMLYAWCSSIEKNVKSPYNEVYKNEKTKLENSQKVTKTRNTQGKLIEAKWCDVKAGHRRGAAIRKAIKHFLADFWKVWREMEGLEARALYPEEQLGHTGIVQPQERGWVYKKPSNTDQVKFRSYRTMKLALNVKRELEMKLKRK
jgi:hypothetical protein